MSESEIASRPSVRLNSEETWDLIRESHTGIFTTLKRDGMPISLPVWFIVLDNTIYIRTGGRKLQRLEHDPRCGFLVESGLKWAELRSVHITGRAEFVERTPDFDARFTAENERKYDPFRSARSAMPATTREHYEATQQFIVRIVPDARILTWDNRKLQVI